MKRQSSGRGAVMRAVVPTLVAVGLLTALAGPAGSTLSAQPGPNPPGEVQHDVSPPLRDIHPVPAPPDQAREHPVRPVPFPSSGAADPVIQGAPGSAAAPALSAGFEGVGNGFSGPGGTFSVNSAPPDPNGAVGPNHFVEIVNQSFAIFNKSGTPVYGPAATNT